jgi:hypothetical protein
MHQQNPQEILIVLSPVTKNVVIPKLPLRSRDTPKTLSHSEELLPKKRRLSEKTIPKKAHHSRKKLILKNQPANAVRAEALSPVEQTDMLVAMRAAPKASQHSVRTAGQNENLSIKMLLRPLRLQQLLSKQTAKLPHGRKLPRVVTADETIVMIVATVAVLVPVKVDAALAEAIATDAVAAPLTVAKDAIFAILASVVPVVTTTAA